MNKGVGEKQKLHVGELRKSMASSNSKNFMTKNHWTKKKYTPRDTWLWRYISTRVRESSNEQTWEPLCLNETTPSSDMAFTFPLMLGPDVLTISPSVLCSQGEDNKAK